MLVRPLGARRTPALVLPVVLVLLGALVALLLPGSSPARSSVLVPTYGAHNDVSTPFNVVHLPTLAQTRFDGGDLVLERLTSRGLGHERHEISYRSAGRRVTGVLLRPVGPGRFPVIAIAHGWSRPDRYAVGGQLEREQAYLADAGYVVVQTDYRNYGGSDREGGRTVRRPRGYPEDLVNLVRAVRRARLPGVDASRVGLLGRSMGGGVVLNALTAVPGLADAAVLSSPLSSSMADNFRRFVGRVPQNAELRDRVVAAYGTPASRPAFWRDISARSRFDRIRVPVRIHHGLADTVCPPRWSRRTTRALRAAGVDARLTTYPGEGHRFSDSWMRSMHRMRVFFDRTVRDA